MDAKQLDQIADNLQSKAGLTSTNNPTEGGDWLRIALAAEGLLGSATTANQNTAGYMQRAVTALEALSATSGAEETAGHFGILKRIVDALEVKAGAVTTGSLEGRAVTAAINAVFVSILAIRDRANAVILDRAGSTILTRA